MQFRSSNNFKNHQDIVRRLIEEEKKAREHLELVRQQTEQAIVQAEVKAEAQVTAAYHSFEQEAIKLENEASQSAINESPYVPFKPEEELPLNINLLHERAEQNLELAVNLLFDRVSGREKRKG